MTERNGRYSRFTRSPSSFLASGIMSLPVAVVQKTAAAAAVVGHSAYNSNHSE